MIVASCAGQVPAAAAASTHSLDDLVAVAPEIVAISLRVGLDVDRRSAALSDDRNGSWARAVIGVSGADAQASIDEFHKAQVGHSFYPVNSSYLTVQGHAWKQDTLCWRNICLGNYDIRSTCYT